MSQLLLCASDRSPLAIEGLQFVSASHTAADLAPAVEQMQARGTPLWLAVFSDASNGILERSHQLIAAGCGVQQSPLGETLLSLIGQGATAAALFYSAFSDDLPQANTTSDLFSILADQFTQPHPMGIELYAVWRSAPGA